MIHYLRPVMIKRLFTSFCLLLAFTMLQAHNFVAHHHDEDIRMAHHDGHDNDDDHSLPFNDQDHSADFGKTVTPVTVLKFSPADFSITIVDYITGCIVNLFEVQVPVRYGPSYAYLPVRPPVFSDSPLRAPPAC